jgi:ATP-dependent helicase HrpA
MGRHRKFRFNRDPGSYEDIHRSLLAGLFRQCGRRKKGSLYQGLGNREFNIFPGSYLHGKSGTWIIGGSFIETSRLFAVSVANVEPEWLEKSCEKLCSYSWSNIRYHKKSGRVMADETVALKGLIIASSRMVNFPKRSPKNIPAARQLFIREALVNAQLTGRFGFLNRNLSLLKKWQESEHRLRKTDIVIDEEAIFDFYEKRLPAEVYDRSSLRGHLKRHDDSNLSMSQTDILLRLPDQKALLDFPPHLPAPNEAIRLNYQFEPGNPDDGVTALIPEHLIEHTPPELFDWLVPGLIVEKTTFLIRGLPKRLRKKLVPVNNTVALLLDSLDMYRGNFLQKLSAAILNRYKITIRRNDWPQDLPPHLVMHFQVVDSTGKTVITGNDFSVLLKQFRSSSDDGSLMVSPTDQALMDSLDQRIFTSWDFDGYPERIPLLAKGGMVGGYLFRAVRSVPEKQGVMLHYYPSRAEADNVTREGMNYLLRLALKPNLKRLAQHCKVTFSGPSALWLTTFSGGPTKTCETVLDFIVRSFLTLAPHEILNRGAYTSQIAEMEKIDIYSEGREVMDKVHLILRQRKETYDRVATYEHLAEKSGSYDADLFKDLYNQLEAILPADFLDHFNRSDLDSCTRHLKSLAIRSERAYNNPGKDFEKRKKLDAHQQNIARLTEKIDDLGSECLEKLDTYKKMLAELRISLFSPEIKTTISVSEKKLDKAWKDLTAGC